MRLNFFYKKVPGLLISRKIVKIIPIQLNGDD